MCWWTGEAIKRNLPVQQDRQAALRERALDLYGNVGFLAKQSLVITPVLGGLFLLGLLLMVPEPISRARLPRTHQQEPGAAPPVAVAVLALVHLALIIWWPTTKFRYLIPLLPLVFGIGAWALWQFGPVGAADAAGRRHPRRLCLSRTPGRCSRSRVGRTTTTAA